MTAGTSECAVSQAVGEQTKKRRGENRREEHPAIGHARLGEAQALRVLEIFDGVGRSEGEEHRRVEHVQRKDVPVGLVEFQ